MLVTVSKWGNSLGVRIPSAIAGKTGISEGDKIEISQSSKGCIVIRKIEKDKKEHKAFGMLKAYADPGLREKEKLAFAMAMEERYGKDAEKC